MKPFKILILDDMDIRHKNIRRALKMFFLAPHRDVLNAYTYSEAVALVEKHPDIDAMCLDHDLGDADPLRADKAPTSGYSGGDSSRYLTGADFCDWLVQTNNIPDKVWIHSANPAGAKTMETILKGKETKNGKRGPSIIRYTAPGDVGSYSA